MGAVVAIAKAQIKLKSPQITPEAYSERWQTFMEKWARLVDIRRDLEDLEADFDAERDALFSIYVVFPDGGKTIRRRPFPLPPTRLL